MYIYTYSIYINIHIINDWSRLPLFFVNLSFQTPKKRSKTHLSPAARTLLFSQGGGKSIFSIAWWVCIGYPLPVGKGSLVVVGWWNKLLVGWLVGWLVGIFFVSNNFWRTFVKLKIPSLLEKRPGIGPANARLKTPKTQILYFSTGHHFSYLNFGLMFISSGTSSNNTILWNIFK